MMTLLYLGIANGMISLCITKSALFEPLRDWFFYRTQRNRVYRFMFKLISCPYCFAHWVAIVMTAIWQPRLTHSVALLDYVVTVFVMVAIANATAMISFGLQTWNKE